VTPSPVATLQSRQDVRFLGYHLANPLDYAKIVIMKKNFNISVKAL
jgi:hypothetical protein